jgi:hypothetical protein
MPPARLRARLRPGRGVGPRARAGKQPCGAPRRAYRAGPSARSGRAFFAFTNSSEISAITAAFSAITASLLASFASSMATRAARACSCPKPPSCRPQAPSPRSRRAGAASCRTSSAAPGPGHRASRCGASATRRPSLRWGACGGYAWTSTGSSPCVQCGRGTVTFRPKQDSHQCGWFRSRQDVASSWRGTRCPCACRCSRRCSCPCAFRTWGSLRRACL